MPGELVITHEPGRMFVTDLPWEAPPGLSPPREVAAHGDPG
jgi:hypothetical protein